MSVTTVIFRLAPLLLVGCGASHARERAEWLRRALLAEETEALARNRGLVREKLERMSRDGFSYFRGTAGVYERDLEDEGDPLAEADSTQVALVGDPHPENLGAYVRPDGSVTLEWNDFDRATYGPYVRDLGRLGVGLYVAADAANLGRDDRRKVVRKMAKGYVEEIAAIASGKAPVRIRAGGGFGRICDDLLAEASDRPDGPLPVAVGATLPDEARRLIERILAEYPSSLPTGTRPPQAALAARGMTADPTGIGSRARLRFQVRVEGETAAPQDDVVLELKEVLHRGAERAVRIRLAYHGDPTPDPRLGWAVVDGISFQVRTITSRELRFDVDRISQRMREKTWKYRDLRVFALHAGRLLARGHALAPGPSGRKATEALARSVAGRDGLADEVASFAEEYGRRTLEDYQLFKRLLRRHGPLLGAPSP